MKTTDDRELSPQEAQQVRELGEVLGRITPEGNRRLLEALTLARALFDPAGDRWSA